eukprot:TRINITY_DN33012_c0_g1_i1.p1 TRINITY_DN33012_c0_g1~~TRINITY_DN33012_c0_g1_i1.p1  ORF type:complete len:358 (+),score=63.23 TRINITY_DN33012_c0_g1_i1:85-1158(+)
MAFAASIIDAAYTDSVIYYCVKVTVEREQWLVWRRYSDFWQLDSRLAAEGRLTRAHLPKKGLLGIRHYFNLGKFNEDRRSCLNVYVEELAKQVTTLTREPLLSQFLTPSWRNHELATRSEDAPTFLFDKEICTRSEECPTFICSGAKSPRAAGSAPPRSKSASCVGAAARTRSLDVPPSYKLPTSGRQLQLDFDDRLRARDVEAQDRAIPTWDSLALEQPALVNALRRSSELANCSRRFENECEEAFKALRQFVRAAVREEAPALAAAPCKGLVLEFLFLVGARRPMLRGQVNEVLKSLLVPKNAEGVAPAGAAKGWRGYVQSTGTSRGPAVEKWLEALNARKDLVKAWKAVRGDKE